jgi:mono/diheme cytochrome c family protein
MKTNRPVNSNFLSFTWPGFAMRTFLIMTCLCTFNTWAAETGSLSLESTSPPEVYARRCSVCHGDDGAGARWAGASLKPPPRNFLDPAIRYTLGREQMISAILHGRPGTAMPAFASRIDADLAAKVADYIRYSFMQLEDTATTTSHTKRNHDPERQIQQTMGGVSGPSQWTPHEANGVAGGVFYRNNCAECHGEDGRGDGPRAYFIFPKPVNFREHGNNGQLSRAQLFHSIKFGVRGREMPAWGTVLNDQQIRDVAEFVYTEFTSDH